MQAFRSLPDFGSDGDCNAGCTGGSASQSQGQRALAAFHEGYQRGYSEGSAQGEKAASSAIAQAAAQFEQQLSREKESWVRDLAEKVSEDLARAFAGLSGNLLERIANVLQPFVDEKVREVALRDLETALIKSLSTQSRVVIEGATEKIALLADMLNARGVAAECHPSDQLNLKIVVDDTTIVSNAETLLRDIQGARDE